MNLSPGSNQGGLLGGRGHPGGCPGASQCHCRWAVRKQLLHPPPADTQPHGIARCPRPQDAREVARQLKRRQKNRVAAQRSRQKHTDKADELHQQHEWLEKDNQALRKEIWSLQAEAKQWIRALEEHQRVCLMAAGPSSGQTGPDGWIGTEPAPLVPPAGELGLRRAQTFPRPPKAPSPRLLHPLLHLLPWRPRVLPASSLAALSALLRLLS
ncbi:basic leucine zipper transcriptional factor ATF-like 2 [Monodelphis domestica]|uniref:basic leucine zipper transcriptional factor ATF-like 2 n=1 Tax=Monodelphis domestica TaxID=13616 RepID=UPI0024E1B016|nr:basic leucine zipper transcriptional factor ATF-like 2 [Monodelphis domestica]